MSGVGDEQVDGTSAAGIAQVMQGACGDGVAAGAATTVGAATGGIVAGAVFQAGFGQVANRGNALGGVRDVLTRSKHGLTLLTQVFPPIVSTLARPNSGHCRC